MKIKDLHHFELLTDGGCKGNGKQDAKCYGSYLLTAVNKDGSKQQGKHEQFDLPGAHTNNQAEYGALIEGLKYTRDLVFRIREGFQDELDLFITTDSQLMANQLLGTAKVKNDGLKPLHQQALSLIGQINAMQCNIGIGWMERELSTVPGLGH